MSMYAVLWASSFLMAQVCPVIRVDGVSAEALGCVRETLPRHGMILEEGEAAAITGPRGAKGSFNWDAGHRVLAVTITGLPFLVLSEGHGGNSRFWPSVRWCLENLRRRGTRSVRCPSHFVREDPRACPHAHAWRFIRGVGCDVRPDFRSRNDRDIFSCR
jgi:hypothetical protein